jgi:hypothetical protein
MVRSFLALYHAADLVDTTGLMTMRITMPIQKYRKWRWPIEMIRLQYSSLPAFADGHLN